LWRNLGISHREHRGLEAMIEEIFKDFEIKVLQILITNKLSTQKLNEIIQTAEFVSYEYTGSGYFLTVRHSNLLVERQVFSDPIVIGEVNKISCGFVVFLENKEMTLECHSWGEIDVPEDFRNKKVEIKITDN
jgi:hypothetical protein